mgnify:CR=1 FL=1
METMNLLMGMLIGFAIGAQLWWNEREYRKQIQKYREEAIKDKEFWEAMYEKEKAKEPKT